MRRAGERRPVSRGGARRRRGHAHALVHAQGAAPALRPADAPARARRARRAAARSHRRGRRPRRRGRRPRRVQEQLVERRAGRVRRADGATGHRRRRRRRAHRLRRRPRRRGRPPRRDRPTPRCCAPETLAMLATEHRLADAAATLLTARLDDPTGYGRVVRDAQRPRRPHRRAGRRQSRRARDRRGQPVDLLLPPWVPRAGAAPAEPRERPGRVLPHRRGRACCAQAGPRRRRHRGRRRHPRCGRSTTAPQLAVAEAELRARINHRWMREGVTMVDPATTYIDTDGGARARRALLPGTILAGSTVVRRGSVIGPDCQLVDTVVGRDAVVRQTVAREAEIGDARHRRPVRVAAARHAPRCRRARRHVRRDQEQRDRRGRQGAAPLLCGRRRDRARARTSAPGNITANYDGRSKHRTKIGKDVRSGSNTVFVAPVDVGDGAYTGAGAVVNRDVPPGALAKGVPGKDRGRLGARSARMRGGRRGRDTRTRRTSSMELVSKKRLMLFAGQRQPRARARRSPPNLQVPLGDGHARRASPTARCTAATARASAAPTSSCCRRTASRSTTASWSSCIMIDAAKRASARRITAVVPVLRLRAPGPQGRGARADHAPGSSPTCSRWRAPTASSPSTSTPARSRASSTSRSTTSPPCRCSPTTWARARHGRGRHRRRRPTPAAASSPAGSRTASASRHRVRARVHRQAPAQGHAQRRRSPPRWSARSRAAPACSSTT